LKVLVVTKGHPFEEAPFFEMFDADPEFDWEHAEHPEAARLFSAAHAGRWDAVVRYDLPGLRFHRGQGTELIPPDPAEVAGLHAMLEAGQGTVFLHHALAGWPAWKGYDEIMGGRYLYEPGYVRGKWWPDSGYRFRVTHRMRAVDPEHPVCAGVPEFELTDELYLAPVFEDAIVPLYRSDANFSPKNFFSPALALRGQRDSNEGWTHPEGSSLVAWAKVSGRSPIVYLQPGDGPSAYGNPGFRRLLGNAIRWVASREAHAWAAAQKAQV
jgi:type 1 glutamine amidotransferase